MASPDSGGTRAPAPSVGEVYEELRRLADRYMRNERARTLQATELVHEAYLRMARGPSPHWESRAHFVAFAAIAMRRLLVERARARGAAKRGDGARPLPLDTLLLQSAQAPGFGPGRADALDLVALDEALEALAARDPQLARVVELRYFGGLTLEETAEAMALSPATVKRHWALARAFLLRALTEGVT
ncbi:MAG: ECF-type sigma factor [Vicinamibacterales bacterium]